MDKHLVEFVYTHKEALAEKMKEHLVKLKQILSTEGIQTVVEYAYEYVNAVNEQSGLNAKTSCSKGCHFCCYGEIGLTGFEASYITSFIDQFDVKFDLELVKQQNEMAFIDLPYKLKKCVMVNKNGTCDIYHIRPLVCRIHNASTPPIQCNEEPGKIDTETLRTVETFSMVMALQSLSDDAEPYKLHKVILSQNG